MNFFHPVAFALLMLASCASPTLPPPDFETPYEKSGQVSSATHTEALAYYQALDQTYDQIKVLEYGKTDVGRPLHVVVVSKNGVFDREALVAQGKRILFINNGIHPGESCGVDACMMLARDLMAKPALNAYLDHVVLCIIPIYNIGGSLNRSCCTRANQVGPTEQGFRGNAKNLDLNRDFIKCDSRNARVFTQLYHDWLPDVFIDTHTTNGADYPAHLTYIPSLPDKADPAIRAYMADHFLPAVKDHMKQAEIPICPYVYNMGRTPEDGIMAFIDHPRYSSGFANLFNSFGFITEAHMLKTFEQRVTATYAFIIGTLGHINAHHEAVGEAVAKARSAAAARKEVTLTWTLDTSRVDPLLFSGYEAKFAKSNVTGQQRWYFDQNSPYEKEINYFGHYKPLVKVQKPRAYIIPQGYDRVIERMANNGVEMKALARDTVLEVEVSYITEYKSRSRPYEGHFYHDDVKTRREVQQIAFYAGDKIIYTGQASDDFVVHVLEPEAHDSYFRWGFFDGVLMQKEYFSPYLFEEEAEKMLAADEKLKADFETKKSAEPAFANNWWAQLFYLYKQSRFYEPTFMRYPVVRWDGRMGE